MTFSERVRLAPILQFSDHVGKHVSICIEFPGTGIRDALISVASDSPAVLGMCVNRISVYTVALLLLAVAGAEADGAAALVGGGGDGGGGGGGGGGDGGGGDFLATATPTDRVTTIIIVFLMADYLPCGHAHM